MVLTYLLTTGTVLVAVRAVFEQWKSRVLSRQNWEDVLRKLQPTATIEITTIALEYMNPGQSAVQTDAATRLASIGGMEGLKRMRVNGNVLIALAAQAERWNPGATRSLVKQMRHDGAELRRTALLLSLHLSDVRGDRGMASVQRAAAAYYRMVYRLLEAAREFSPTNLKSLSNAIWT